MSPDLPPPGSSRPSSNHDLLRLGEAVIRFGAEALGQGVTLTSRSWGREVNNQVQGVLRSARPETLLRGAVNSYVNWLGELASIVPSLVEKIAMELALPTQDHPEATEGDRSAPTARAGENFEIDGQPFALPARVLDASEGWSVFFVPTEAANRALGEASEFVTAFDAGGGRTPLMIVASDYRNSDFGVYPELVVALTVTAKGDPAGQLFHHCLAIVVNQEFTKRAAHAIWGLEKIFAPNLTVGYAADTALFGLPKALSIRFPRFGDGESSDRPTFSLSQRGQGSKRRNYWSMTTRSGSGEGMQIGGSVVLQLGEPEQKLCLCADGKTACLCDTLRGCELAGKLPASNGWTERQTALYGPPHLLNLPTSAAAGGQPLGKTREN